MQALKNSSTSLSWRMIQKSSFTNLSALCEFLELSEEDRTSLIVRPKFPLNLPYRLAKKIKKGTLNDPILKQFVPLNDELNLSSNFTISPTKDECFSKTAKLLKKYERRALLITTSACAMHCRFCFRQNYPYETKDKVFREELEIIKEDTSLVEIILSGGDPLSLSDEILKELIGELDKIEHLKILRFHTRFPIGIPERITESFLEVLSSTRLQVIFVTHINHPLELDSDVAFHLKKVQKLGIPILNHTVLLKDVNDDITTLTELNLSLIKAGILPYYLNQLDKVQGCMHFEVSIEKGEQLVKELRENLPGYAVPRYIEEIPGKKHKSLIF
jgi:EF-P beta-lysylation protein EpmB